MEKLRARCSFTYLQCKKTVDDAYKLVNDALQVVIRDVVPMVADNIADNIVMLLEQEKFVLNENNNEILVEETVLEDDSLDLAIQFMNDNSEFIKSQLIFRNQAYTNFVNTVATIDLYDECLSENPVFVPRKFRNDNRHCLSKDERDVVDKISIQKLKGETEFLQCRRDEFRRRIKNGDSNFTSFVRNNIPNEDVFQEVMTVWNSALRVDEEKVDELQIKKTESLRKAHQKDKLSQLSRGTPSGTQSTATGTIPTSAQSINPINSASTTDRGNRINSITNRANSGVQNPTPEPGSHQGEIHHQTPQTAGHTSTHNQHTKNENSHRKKKKTKKKNPPHLASLTYLTSISNQRISAC